METLNIAKTERSAVSTINLPSSAYKQVVEGTQAVSVINAEKLPWISIGIRIGFGIWLASAGVGVILGILYVVWLIVTAGH